jgi:aminoglycoside phosphotransferase (APT) family kinase protein
MHPDEVHTDVALVRGLLAAQFPRWAELPVEAVASSGTVNALYRLGAEMVVRLPRTDWAPGAMARQMQWLPTLARSFPVAVPRPLAIGAPALGYPYEWGVTSWVQGQSFVRGSVAEEDSLARRLAEFVSALHAIVLPGGPPQRRGSLHERWDGPTRAALDALRGEIDTGAATAAWEVALAAPLWAGPSVWVHGDLMPANLVVEDGVLTGIIDWEAFGVGDPAVDLMVAWNSLSSAARKIFRDAVDVDEAAWQRGRGWALCTGLVALPYYRETNPELADNARFRIAQVLAD